MDKDKAEAHLNAVADNFASHPSLTLTVTVQNREQGRRLIEWLYGDQAPAQLLGIHFNTVPVDTEEYAFYTNLKEYILNHG